MTRKRKHGPARLLRNVARSLNACERAGIHVTLEHGVVVTSAGYVLPVKDRWAARPLRKLR